MLFLLPWLCSIIWNQILLIFVQGGFVYLEFFFVFKWILKLFFTVFFHFFSKITLIWQTFPHSFLFFIRPSRICLEVHDFKDCDLNKDSFLNVVWFSWERERERERERECVCVFLHLGLAYFLILLFLFNLCVCLWIHSISIVFLTYRKVLFFKYFILYHLCNYHL
jgi:hypothetical protein